MRILHRLYRGKILRKLLWRFFFFFHIHLCTRLSPDELCNEFLVEKETNVSVWFYLYRNENKRSTLINQVCWRHHIALDIFNKDLDAFFLLRYARYTYGCPNAFNMTYSNNFYRSRAKHCKRQEHGRPLGSTASLIYLDNVNFYRFYQYIYKTFFSTTEMLIPSRFNKYVNATILCAAEYS